MILIVVGATAIIAVVIIAWFIHAMYRLDNEDTGEPWTGPKHAALASAEDQYDADTGAIFEQMNRGAAEGAAEPEVAHEPVPFLTAPPAALDTPVHEGHMTDGPPVAGRPVAPAGSGHAHADSLLLPSPLLAGALACQVIITTAERLLWEAGAAERERAAQHAALEQLRTQPLDDCPWLREGNGYQVCAQDWLTDSGIIRAITATDTPETVTS